MVKMLLCGSNQNITCEVNLFFSYRFERNNYDLSNMYCGYIDRDYVYYLSCTERKNVLCVETASTVQVDNVLNDLPEGRK